MKTFNVVNVCAVAMSVLLVGVAHAGPQVKMTFKNNGSADALYDVVGSSAYSYAQARPKPEPKIPMGQ